MFDALRSTRSDIATDVSYHVGLRVWERDRFPNWRRSLRERPDDRIRPEALTIATEILEQIESGTGKPLADLTDEEVHPYLRAMYEVMDRRREAERTLDPAVARRILEEMRRDYGGGQTKAVA